MGRSDVLAKLGKRKNGQVQVTLKTRTCTLFLLCICTLKDSQNNLVSKSEKLFEANLENCGENKKGQKCTKTIKAAFLRHRQRVKLILAYI
jgi:hypothetical protein